MKSALRLARRRATSFRAWSSGDLLATFLKACPGAGTRRSALLSPGMSKIGIRQASLSSANEG
jgi:hypothetical protein